MSEPVVVNLRALAQELGLHPEKVQSVVELLDEGHPVPFIARYRKDQTGNLDEEDIRAIQTELQVQRTLAERKQTILRSIESLGKLTPELDQKIRDARTTKRLEDIYLPYKPKKQTLASVAKSKGLEPLALEIMEMSPSVADLDSRATEFISDDKGVKTVADALLGAGHIISEYYSEKLELRHKIREIVQKSCVIVSQKIETKKDTTDNADGTAPEPKPKKKRERKPKNVEIGDSPKVEEPTSSDTPQESVAAPEIAVNSEPSAENVSTENAPAVEIAPVTEIAPAQESTEVAENFVQPPAEADSAGAGGGEIIESENTDNTESNNADSQNAQHESKEEQPKEGQPAVEEVKTAEISENQAEIPTETASETTVETIAEKVESTENAPTGEIEGDKDAEEVNREFQNWKDRQKEQGQPVVRSQNQIKKKKNAEKKKEKAAAKARQQEHFEKQFHDYFDFSSTIKKMPPHRILALNRGEKAKILRIRLDSDNAAMESAAKEICVQKDNQHADYLGNCAKDAVERLVLPTMEREVRTDLTENAESQAVRVFAKNLRNLLLQPPLHRKRVLALDPGFKHGCKMVALDEFGNVLDHATVYLTGGAEKKKAAEAKIVELIKQFKTTIIAIGNGTACRETEEFISAIIANHFTKKESDSDSEQIADVSYVIVNEAGASVYSASPAAKEEFPNYDILLRGAISIGRRLQDPLNELVKIDPESLGVGMYQHDLKAKYLRETLNNVVESCVNFVGVDLNTATPAILRYVSGLNQLTAKRVYDYRMEHGPFKSREELKKVPGLGEVAFTHCAGFLRIADGTNPLDSTWIHPEMYGAATSILEKIGYSVEDLRVPEKVKELAAKCKTVNVAELAESLGIGPHTVQDILNQLAKPGRDPREGLPQPIFKKGVLHMNDLSPGMELSGTVLNVVDFGAFVDVGLHDSGLIHISQMADKYVQDAHDFVAVGDIVRVWVVDVDSGRGRISLTMVPPGTVRSHEQKHDRPPRREQREPRENTQNQGDSGSAPRRERQLRSDSNRDRAPSNRGGGAGDRPHSDRGQGSLQNRDRGTGGGDFRDKRDASRDGGGRDRDRGHSRDRGRFEHKPKTFTSAPQEKVLAPISDKMKKGKEPLRSFGDLAQLLGRVQVVDPEEEKRRKKEEKKAAKKNKSSEQSGAEE